MMPLVSQDGLAIQSVLSIIWRLKSASYAQIECITRIGRWPGLNLRRWNTVCIGNNANEKKRDSSN